MRSDDDAPRDGAVVEWAPFQLRAGVGEPELLAAAEALQRAFLERQPGFVRRELLRGTDGGWVDLVYWRDEPAAAAAMQAAHSSPVCHTYFHLMDGGESVDAGAGVLHLQRVRVYGLEGAMPRAE